MIDDQRSRSCDEGERLYMVRRATRAREWWVIIASVVYVAARVLPWILAGCPV